MTNVTQIQKAEDPSLSFEFINNETCLLSATGNIEKVAAERIKVKLCNCLALYNAPALCDLGDFMI